MSNYKEYDQKTLKKLHDVQLEMLDVFAKICEKYDFHYSLAGGTMLGAIRHKGFIPWDDDIDILMPRREYEKFLMVAQQELGDKYYLDYFDINKDYYLQFAKIKKNGTIFDEASAHHLKLHKGIYIDIFPMDNVYDNIKRSYLDAVMIKTIGQTIGVKNGLGTIKDTRHPVFSTLLRVFPKKMLMKVQKWLSTKNKNDNSKYITCYFGYAFKKELMERKDFFPTKLVEFEGRKYQAMNNHDKYLSGLYGDYMKLPPVEKRVNHMPLKIDFGDNNED